MSEVKMMKYSLSIAGKALDEERLLMIDDIIFEDNMTGSDLLTIVINDPDFIYIEDDIFIEEKSVTFKGGWKGDEAIKFEGYISVVDIDFPDTGSPRLILHCMDNSHMMNRKKKKRTWNNKKVSDVATQIFKEHGFKAEVDATTKVEETISQSDTTDINFLIDLANKEKDDFIVYVEGNTAYFKKVKLLESPQATLSYRKSPFDIQNFNPRINKETMQEEISKSNIDSGTKAVETSTVTSESNRDVQGTPVKTTEKNTGGSSKSSSPSRVYQGGGVWIEKQ